MNNIKFIAIKDFIYLLKDKTVLIWMFIMPLVFFAFIGTTTGGFSSGGQNVTLAIWYDGDENDPVAQQIYQRLAAEDFALRYFSEANPLYKEKYEFKDYGRQLWLPTDMGSTLKSGEQVTIEYRFKDDDMGAQLNEFKLQKAVYQTLGDYLVLKMHHNQAAKALDFSVVNNLPDLITLDVSQGGEQHEIPNGFKQAVPGILVMFIMMISLTSGAFSLFLERKTGVLRRLAAAPISRKELILGKWLGKLMLATVQLIYGMIMGMLLFKIHWGEHWLMVFILLFAWSAVCAGFAVLMGSLATNEGQINGIPVLVSMLLAALGGCWWPIEITPEWMQQLAMFLPTGWVMDALHKLMYFGGDLSSVVNHQLALYALAVISLYFAFTKFNPDFKG
ncbi:ABC transporter permease [Marinicella rhabdoformis]|uniref:ABC transporter permease n=1 Tax=Marinicella rhabdoformis TaxID=2580566 RepID=UPI0012AEC998|nr:ABC transporter permease [Marinicella rhabdoformis]